jgi:preprotein translocase SecE subunit
MSIITYFKETKNEMKHVTWPSMRQAVIYTVAVVVVSVAVALLLGFFDYIFSEFIIKNVI